MIYLLAWTGGYELPQYAILPTMEDAEKMAEGWAEDWRDDDGTSIVIHQIDPGTLTMTAVGWPRA